MIGLIILFFASAFWFGRLVEKSMRKQASKRSDEQNDTSLYVPCLLLDRENVKTAKQKLANGEKIPNEEIRVALDILIDVPFPEKLKYLLKVLVNKDAYQRGYPFYTVDGFNWYRTKASETIITSTDKEHSQYKNHWREDESFKAKILLSSCDGAKKRYLLFFVSSQTKLPLLEEGSIYWIVPSWTKEKSLGNRVINDFEESVRIPDPYELTPLTVEEISYIEGNGTEEIGLTKEEEACLNEFVKKIRVAEKQNKVAGRNDQFTHDFSDLYKYSSVSKYNDAPLIFEAADASLIYGDKNVETYMESYEVFKWQCKFGKFGHLQSGHTAMVWLRQDGLNVLTDENIEKILEKVKSDTSNLFTSLGE